MYALVNVSSSGWLLFWVINGLVNARWFITQALNIFIDSSKLFFREINIFEDILLKIQFSFWFEIWMNSSLHNFQQNNFNVSLMKGLRISLLHIMIFKSLIFYFFSFFTHTFITRWFSVCRVIKLYLTAYRSLTLYRKKISAFFNISRVFKMLKLLLSILQGLNADNPDVSWSLNFLPALCHFLKHMSCVDRSQHLAYSVKNSCLERREVVSMLLRFLISQNSPVVVPLKMNEMPDALAFIPAIFISQSCNFFKVSHM